MSDEILQTQADETKNDETVNERVAALESQVAGKTAELTAANAHLAELEAKLVEAGNSLGKAVTSYRTLVVKVNPGIPEELIAGNSVEEIELALGKAETLVRRVRQQVKAEVISTRVPAGAPERRRSGGELSPREKIQYAIGGKK